MASTICVTNLDTMLATENSTYM